MTVSKTDDYAFIAMDTVARADGVEDSRLRELNKDLFLHVKENRELPEPLVECQGRKITFDLDFKVLRRDGSPLVYGAKL